MSDLVTIGFRADTSQLKTAEKDLNSLSTAGGKTDNSLSTLQSTVGALGAAMAALGVAAVASKLGAYADSATNVENQLNVVTKTTKELTNAQERLGKIANESRAGYEATVGLYSKLARSTEELGISSERLFKITETINKSFAVSGASAQEMDGAIRQLGQGLASGALRGDEFNSVAEAAPEILRAISKETGMSVGALREFAAQGGITSELLIKSIENYGDTVEKTFATSSSTIEQAFTVANNNAIKFVENNESIRSSAKLFGETVIDLSNNLGALAESARAAGAVIGVYLAGSIAASVSASVKKAAADYAAITAAQAATLAEKQKAAAIAATALAESQAGVISAREAATRLATTQAALVAEMNLEKVRLAAQISETGRIHTSTRMAEIGAARVAVSNQLTAAEARLAAAESAATAATAAHATSLTAVSAAQSTAAVTASALGAAWRFMLGPWGLVITSIGAAAAAFALTSDESDILTKSLGAQAAAASRLGQEVEKTKTIYEAYIETQRQNDSLKLAKMGQIELQKEFDKSTALVDFYTKRLEKLKESQASFARITEVQEKLAAEKFQLEEIQKLMPGAKSSYTMLSEEAQKLVDKLDPLTKLNREYAADLELLSKAKDKNLVSDAQFIQYQAALKKELAESTDKITGQSAALLKLQKIQEGWDDAEYERITAALEEMDKIAEDNADAYADYVEQGIEAIEKQKDSINGLALISEKAAERIESAFADAWLNAFDGFESVVDGMKNAFKRMLAEMAHMALTKPIMVSMGLGGLLPGGASAATGAGSAASGLSSLSGVGGIAGMLGGFGAGATGSAALLGAGQVGTAFGLTGNLFAAGEIMTGLGAAMPLTAGIAAIAGLTDKLTGGGLFGTSYKMTGQSLGLSLGNGDVSGSITTEEAKKKALFGGTKRRSSTSAYDASAIDDAFDQITASLGAAAERLGITGADEILKGFSASLNLNIKDMTQEEISAAIQSWVGSTTEGMIQAVFGDAAEGLGVAGESALDTLVRVTANFESMKSVADTLGLKFDLTGKAGLAAATNIVNLIGGLDQLSALSSQYYQEFYSEAERQAQLQTQLSDAMGALGYSMVTSKEDFRGLIEALDLTSAEGQAAYAALMQLVPGMAQYLNALESQEEASRRAAEAAQKEAEAKAKALAQSQSDLELRLMDALGQSSEALARRRQLELEATDESLRHLLLAIYAAEDAARAQAELAAAQNAAARAAEDLKASLNSAAQDAFGKLQESINAEKENAGLALQTKLDAIDKERDALKSAHDATMAAYAAQSSAIEGAIDRLQGLSDVINDFIGEGSASVDPFKRLTQILTEAKIGLLPTQSELSSVFSGINSRGASGFSSAFEMRKAIGIAQNQAAELGGIVGNQLTDAERQLNAIVIMQEQAEAYYQEQLAKLDLAEEEAKLQHDEQIEKLDNQLSLAEKRLNVLLGIDDSLLSLDEAQKRFDEAFAAAAAVAELGVQSQIEAINNVSATIREVMTPPDEIQPIVPITNPVQGSNPLTNEEVIALLREIVAGNESIAKSSKTSADALDTIRFETGVGIV